MTVEQAVVERLAGDAAVIALAADRIYQLVLPQSLVGGALGASAIRVQLIDHPLLYHLRGGVVFSWSRVQTDAWYPASLVQGVDPYDAASDLADAITAAMSGQRWSAVGTPSIDVRTCYRLDRTPGFEDAEIHAVRIRQDWRIGARHG